jgi:gluconolactonase
MSVARASPAREDDAGPMPDAQANLRYTGNDESMNDAASAGESLDIATLTVWPQPLDHAEGVAWGLDGKVYAGGEAGQLYRLDLHDGSVETFANTGGNVLGVALDAAGNLYACDLARKAVLRATPTGVVSVYCAGNAEQAMRLPNYPVFDASGNLFVSDSGEWGRRDGLIWRIRPDGHAEVWDRQANGFTNGLCLSPDRRWLYVVESSPPLVARIPFRKDGSAGPREVLFELPRTVPDGVAFDSAGALYISLYNPNIIYRFHGGTLRVLYDDWEQLKLLAPTNIAFGGADMKTLLIANLCGLNLASAQMSVAGLPLEYPKL